MGSLARNPLGGQQTAEPETPKRNGVVTAKVGQADDVARLRLKTVLDTSTQQGPVLLVTYSNGGQNVIWWSKSGALAAV